MYIFGVPVQSNEVQFFGGNTLYIKVSRYWHEVPKEEYESLKQRLLQMVAQFSDNKAIVGRLLKAVSDTCCALVADIGCRQCPEGG